MGPYPTIAEAAIAYAAKGWKPIPVKRGDKKATGTAWQKPAFNPSQFDGNSLNVAIQMGEVSGGLCDVDLDCMTAIGLAPEFLPETGAIFGHVSRPASHQLYVSDLHESEDKATIPFKDNSGSVLVELRIGGSGKGAASVFPPSMHKSGETVQWARDGKPAHVKGGELKRAVLKLATACLLKQNYPGNGSRHEGALVLGGVLARAGWAKEEIQHVVKVVARAADDDDVRDRVDSAVSAVDRKANGQDVPGLVRLREVWGDAVADPLSKWLACRKDGKPKGAAGYEDDVALQFAEQHADHFRYVAASSQWMKFTGSRWEPEVTLGAFDESRKLCREAGDADAKVVAAVITLARSDRRIAASAVQWNAQPMLFNTMTGTVDLTTGMVRPADRLDYLTKQAGTYLSEPGTPCPLWDAFLKRVTDNNAELIGFLKPWAIVSPDT